MVVLKRVVAHEVAIGGEPPSGWLPENASTPLATAIRELLFDITIEFDGSGYMLCYESSNGEFKNDTWHPTLAEAEAAAAETFLITSEQWENIDSSTGI